LIMSMIGMFSVFYVFSRWVMKCLFSIGVGCSCVSMLLLL